MRTARATLPWVFVSLLLCVALTSALGQETKPDGAKAVMPARIDKPLIAHWSFDELAGDTCIDSSGDNHDASPEQPAAPGFRREPGLFGGALQFSGRHKLRVPGKPEFGKLQQISLSAWTLPTGTDRYLEVFRKEDGNNRVLFAFQEHNKILSLGLNVGGYVECDAKIDPKQVLDGAWHHCAATFDGRFMRVYLDGKEIGSLERLGEITAGGMAPGCIGSSNGGECFQGGMDELRIYSQALTPDEIAGICRTGVKALAAMSEPVDAGEPQIDKPLLAHWTFNERAGAPIIQDYSGSPELAVKKSGGVERRRGVYGNALVLSGSQSLESTGGLQPTEAAKITLAAWTKPLDVGGQRDIFRQKGAQRLLLAFQENGSVLAAGMDIGGYVECDARIDPAHVCDGRWHHCVATFDGQFVRVYLDGKEVGSLGQTGRLTIDPAAPALIASVEDAPQQFHGSLDDLRVYADALTAEEIARLYQSGQASVALEQEKFVKAFDSLYAPGQSFAETLAGSRRNVVKEGMRPDRDVIEAFSVKLKAGFPEDYANFVSWTGTTPTDYLLSPGDEFNDRHAGRLVEMMLEYRPLTDCQKQKQTAEELRHWAEAEAIEQRLTRLKASGDSARFSPDWIAVMLEAGSRIQFRPHVQEAVAPYLTPQTPDTRDLTTAEARQALERDWLHQADQKPTPERIRAEIDWTRQLAARIASEHPGRVDFAKELTTLGDLGKQAEGLSAPDQDLYFRVREVKRTIVLKNPIVDFDKVLYVDMPFPQGKEWPHETRHRLGYQAVPGARLMIQEGLGPDGTLRQLMPQAPLHGSFWRPDVSYDGQKVLFCFKPHNEKAFHLYEINADGTGLVQLTDGQFDDFDPIYLPDEEHIVFSTTRGHTYVRCMPPTNAYVLARCERDGKNIYLISRNNEPDYLPSVMNDGRIVYTRWEYTDKPLWRAQGIWTVNPDGSQVNTFWGNQTVWPDLCKDARSIPGSRRVMFTGSAHHNWFSGSVGILDRDLGFNFPDGLTKVTADTAWPESGNGPVDPVESPNYHASGHYSAYYSPYPLSETDFLVSANRGGKFVLYLMDVDGNRELIYEGINNIFHALPLKPRPRPPVVIDQVVWPTREERLNPKPGAIYSANVYYGAPDQMRDKAKFLRVLNIEHKTYTYWHKRPYISTGPVVSAVQSEGVKRVLGTVPIEADGSVAFYAPPGIPLHFQLLDERYRALQTMRSFTGVMPGEQRGCLGCHELHSTTPELNVSAMAFSKEPQQITPPPWGEDSVSYMRYVQPVLDKYCGKCHQGDGKGRKTLDLTVRPGYLMFDEPYWTLIGRPSWGKAHVKPENPPPGLGIANMLMVEGYDQRDPKAYQTPEPMTYLSYRSKLIEQASSGKHHDVKVDPISLRRLIAWVDTMCPYRGDEEVRAIDDPDFQGVDWISIRPKIKTAPTIIRPGPVE